MSRPPEPALTFIYIDDSGAEDTGFATRSWIEFCAQVRPVVENHWLGVRRELHRRYRIPASYELHTTRFVRGEGRPSHDPKFNRSQELRREAMQFVVGSIGTCAELSIGTVFRRTDRRGHGYFAEKMDLYGRLLARFDTQLTAGEKALVIVDGKESSYHRRKYREVQPRNFLCAPIFQRPETTQLLQVADILAWTTYQSILKHPGKQFASSWYDTYLRHLDRDGGPLRL